MINLSRENLEFKSFHKKSIFFERYILEKKFIFYKSSSLNDFKLTEGYEQNIFIMFVIFKAFESLFILFVRLILRIARDREQSVI